MPTSTSLIMRRRSRKARKAAERRSRSFWTALAVIAFTIVFLLPLGGAIGGAAVIYASAVADMPSPQASLSALTVQGVTRFYDRDTTRLLYSLEDPLGASRTWRTLDDLPRYVPEAMLAAEDPAFLEAAGFNPVTVGTDIWQNALIETLPPDMSITGRLVRNLMNPEGTGAVGENLSRQREIALVAEINRRYTPEEILEWHLNTEYYGSEAWGIEAAAQIYLGKTAAQLTLGEAALLAAIPNALQYNPFEDEVAARGRGQGVLRALLAAGGITEGEFSAAVAEPITIRREGFVQQLAPDFMAYARRQAETILTALGYDGRQLVARGGLTITTTLDATVYLQTECAMRAQMAVLAGGDLDTVTALDGSQCAGLTFLPATDAGPLDSPPDQGAAVVMDAQTGEILALVGAAAQADAQPGVTLQPFVYLDSFVNPRRLTSPATMALDIPLSFPGAEEGLIYTAQNPDGRFYGVMNLRQAMGAALLPPAADTAYRQGMGSVLRTAHQMGINSLADDTYDIMLLERGGRVSPLDIAYAYSVFAASGDFRGVGVEPVGPGFRVRDPVAVAQITDRDGNVLWAYDAAAARTCRTLDVCTPRLDKALAYLVTDVYADQTSRWQTLGQGNVLEMTRAAAVVNGPAGDGTDSWTVGYTPQFVAAVHPGATEAAGSVWRAVMDYIHTRDVIPPGSWERPAVVVEQPVCERSGLLPNGVCPTYIEIFPDGMQPRQIDTFWQVVDVNDRTGQLATVNTPPELVSARTFFVPPEEALAWWRDNNNPLPPVEYDTVSVPELFSRVRLLSPQAFSYVSGTVEILGELDADGMQYFQLSYGEGLNPSRWIDIGGQQRSYDPAAPLGTWNTAGLDGLYSLRLVLTREGNTFESDALQVTIDNTPPRITLDSAEAGRIYRFPADDEIALEARVEDNVAVSRVEFFLNGAPLGADESWPYQVNVDIEGPGVQTFEAVVYDAVGQSASATLTVDVLRG
jgi:membrane peptidoglycan carboxypeptidase